MLGTLFIVIFSDRDLFTRDKNGHLESISFVVLEPGNNLELGFLAMFLAPFQQLAFEVVIKGFESVNVKIFPKYLSNDEPACATLTPVEVDCTDQGFKRIAQH